MLMPEACRKAMAKLCKQIMTDILYLQSDQSQQLHVSLPLWNYLDLMMWEMKIFLGTKHALDNLYKFLEELQGSEVKKEAAKHGTMWSWGIHYVDSPHRNRAAEGAVRTVKKALQILGGDGIFFTCREFQTFVHMAANLANESPKNAKA